MDHKALKRGTLGDAGFGPKASQVAKLSLALRLQLRSPGCSYTFKYQNHPFSEPTNMMVIVMVVNVEVFFLKKSWGRERPYDRGHTAIHF